MVVLDAPFLGENLHLLESGEGFEVEMLVPHFSVEAFIVSVLPRAARFDELRLHAKFVICMRR